MDLDASKLKCPLIQQRKRELREHVKTELQMIRRKIVLATTMGVTEIRYRILPTFKYPDPSVPQAEVLAELTKKQFDAFPLDGSEIIVRWGEVSE